MGDERLKIFCRLRRAVSERAVNGTAIAKLWCMPDEFDLVDESRGRKYCSLDNARMTIERMQALQVCCRASFGFSCDLLGVFLLCLLRGSGTSWQSQGASLLVLVSFLTAPSP